MPLPLDVRGFLFDVDGTLLVHDQPVPGVAEVVTRLREGNVPFRIITNITRRSQADIAASLASAGLEVPESWVLCPAVLARQKILASGRLRVSLLVPDTTAADLQGLTVVDQDPDWVVIADLGNAFTWELLNQAFAHLRGGASLLALHRNPWWDVGPPQGIVLDAGAFVAALEFASGRPAQVVGKPSGDFFELALAELGLPAGAVAVVGDDALADIGGGTAAGCRTVLVQTGRFQGDPVALSPPPDLVLPSVAHLLDEG